MSNTEIKGRKFFNQAVGEMVQIYIGRMTYIAHMSDSGSVRSVESYRVRRGGLEMYVGITDSVDRLSLDPIFKKVFEKA